MTSRALSPPRMPEVRTLGILGNRQTDSEKEVWAYMEAIAETVGRRPDRILIPAEGNFSIYTQSWADSKKIQYTLFECDWIRLGKRAAVMRDMAIQKEADHFLLVKSPKGKSDRLDKLAATFARKHIQVFLLGEELEEVEMAPSEPSTSGRASGSAKRAPPEPVRKSANEITSWLQKLTAPKN
jgi:hypothetical protein